MNGVHDMGGQHGMGPVQHEKDEPVFHATWEGRVDALNRAMRAWRKWNLDTDRHALEILPPVDYLRMSYYERWFDQARNARREIRLRHAGRTEERKGGAGSRTETPVLTLATSRPLAEPRIAVERRSKRSTVVQGRPARSRSQHPSHRPYSPAAIRARQGRSRDSRSRRPCVPRHQRALSRREASARVLGALHRARVVGRAGFAARLGASRHVG